ncbi:MAG: ribosome-associated translation inhibitor RaiA [Robiginitomaculum sp.]|nr:ribosome-associated translation inhibitor RaiA [Robiginitomaculum sp.]
MSIQIVNQGIDISPALHNRVSDRVMDGLTKYFDRPGEAYIVIEREGHNGFKVHCSVHLPTGAMLQTSAKSGNDAYAAADAAMEKLETRLRRYKRKLRNHHKGKRSMEAEEALYAVLQSGQTTAEAVVDEEDGNDAAPEAVVVSEKIGELQSMTVSMAVMDMDITGAQVLLFRNIANGEINALYRRPDGHIGWMNPQKSNSPVPA